MVSVGSQLHTTYADAATRGRTGPRSRVSGVLPQGPKARRRRSCCSQRSAHGLHRYRRPLPVSPAHHHHYHSTVITHHWLTNTIATHARPSGQRAIGQDSAAYLWQGRGPGTTLPQPLRRGNATATTGLRHSPSEQYVGHASMWVTARQHIASAARSQPTDGETSEGLLGGGGSITAAPEVPEDRSPGLLDPPIPFVHRTVGWSRQYVGHNTPTSALVSGPQPAHRWRGI